MCHAIANARDLHHFRNVMRATDVRSTQNTRCDGCRRAPDSFFRWGRFPVAGERRPEKSFARSAHKQRIAERSKLRQLLQQFVVLRVTLPEANPRIQDTL